MSWVETNWFVLKTSFLQKNAALISYTSITTGSRETTPKVLPTASNCILLFFSLVSLRNDDVHVFYYLVFQSFP